MICPYCQEPMEKGFIQSARAFFWSRKKSQMFFIPSKNDISIAKGMNGSYKEAYYCKKCNKMIFDVID